MQTLTPIQIALVSGAAAQPFVLPADWSPQIASQIGSQLSNAFAGVTLQAIAHGMLGMTSTTVLPDGGS